MTRDTGERRNITEHCPLPFDKGGNGYIGTFSYNSITGPFIVYKTTWNKFIAAIRVPRIFRMVFYNFFYYFWGQHCCWTETSMFFCFFISFHCAQLFYCIPRPTAAPASLPMTTNVVVDISSLIQTQLSAVCSDNDIGLYVNSAKTVKDDRKCTFLANSYALPPECVFWKDANGERAFMGNFLRYTKGETFYERPFVSNLKTLSKMSILPTLGKISADASLMYERTHFFKHCFPRRAWTSFGHLLTNPIQWSVSKPSK